MIFQEINVQNETGIIILWWNTTIFEKLSYLTIIKLIPWTSRASSRSKNPKIAKMVKIGAKVTQNSPKNTYVNEF